MNAYFYSDNGTQKGPVTYEGLKRAGIGKYTLVWRDGFDDWQEAGNVLELSGLFIESTIPTESIQQSDSVSARGVVQTKNEKPEINNTKMFKNVFLFKGRAKRSEFWVAFAVFYATMILPSVILDAGGDSGSLSFLCIALFIGGIWLFLSEGTRRCHDLGHSGFWMLIPYYILWMLFQNSKVGPNEYGNNPKGEIIEHLH